MLIALYKHVCYNKGNVTIAMTLGEELERKRTIGRNSEQHNRKGKHMVRKYQNKNNKNKIKDGFITANLVLGLVLMSATGEGWEAMIANLIGLGLLALTAVLAKRVTEGA